MFTLILLSFYKNDLLKHKNRVTEAVVRRCSVEKVFLEISQNSRETPEPESLF